MPDEHASRRERFAPIDEIQGGWRVELRRGGSSVVDAVFFSPDGVLHKSFADARREAMRAKRRERDVRGSATPRNDARAMNER